VIQVEADPPLVRAVELELEWFGAAHQLDRRDVRPTRTAAFLRQNILASGTTGRRTGMFQEGTPTGTAWETRDMKEPGGENEAVFRNGTAKDTSACVSLWVAACATRDGAAVGGVAERARPKFDSSECWIVAEAATEIVGFVLATKPGTGQANDPPVAPVVGLLAVSRQSGTRAWRRSPGCCNCVELALHGHEQSVLHVLADNHTAVHLYEREGWQRLAGAFRSALPRRFAVRVGQNVIARKATSIDTPQVHCECYAT
jgi:hypothetical protein